MALLSASQRAHLAAAHPQWVIDGEQVSRVFEFADFVDAMGFVTRVGMLAEKSFHHPDIDIRWNRVTLTFTTHSEGGLTEKDVQMVDTVDNRV